MNRALLAFWPIVFLVVASCSSPRIRAPHIMRIYEQAALDEIRNPVIVIHGILGAALHQRSTDKVVWGAFDSNSLDPNTKAGAAAMGLPLDPPISAFDYDPDRADVYPSGPLGELKLSLFFNTVAVEVYARIIRTLGVGGYVDRVGVDPLSPSYASDHYSCYTFFYDWRRDNVENAIQLGRFLAKTRLEIDAAAATKAQRLRDEGSAEAADRIEQWLTDGYRFDLVAHSMGGLVSRYFLRYGMQDLPADGTLPELNWAGAEEIDRLICVGTPNLGSMDALRNLSDGFSPSFILPNYHPGVLGTMPSIYQLLPRARHRLVVDAFGEPTDLDFMDPAVWQEHRWGLLSESAEPYLAWLLPDVPDAAERQLRAERYQAWCLGRASQFHAALDVEPLTSSPARLTIYAADAERTLTYTRIRDGQPSYSDRSLNHDGDGTVARYSAVGDERFGRSSRSRLVSPIGWDRIVFLADDHLGLTTNPQFVDNMLFELLEEPIHRSPPGRETPWTRPTRSSQPTSQPSKH